MISFSKILKKILTERMSFKDLLRHSDPARIDRSRNVNVRSLLITTMDGNEAWTFTYKSNPSTTGHRWHGYVRFFKEDVSQKDSANELDCMVDCDCPDYRYRWAYNNAAEDAGALGPNAWNDNNGRPPRPIEQGGVGNMGPGMCIAEGELVSTKRGLIPIQNVNENDEVWTLEGWNKVIKSLNTGFKNIIEIQVESGNDIKLTPEHKIFVFSEERGFEWIKAGLLTSHHFLCSYFPDDIDFKRKYINIDKYQGDKLYYPSKKIELDVVMAELLGYMISEGSKNGIFSNDNSELNKDFFNKWSSKFGSNSCIMRHEGCYVGSHGDKILQQLGFINGSYFKEVPNWILQGNKEVIKFFLRGCYAGDGNFRNRHSTYATVSKKLAKGIHLLVESLGVRSSLKCYRSGVNKSWTWVIRTSSKEETEKLYSLLNPIRKYSSYNSYLAKQIQFHYSRNDYFLKNVKKFIKTQLLLYGKSEIECREIMDEIIFPKTWLYKIHRKKIANVIFQLKNKLPGIYKMLKPLTVPRIRFIKVKNIQNKNETLKVYDLKIKNVEHFTVNGIVVHNCKHLIALGEHLRTKIEPDAPVPPKAIAPKPTVKPVPKLQPVQTPKIKKPKTAIDAPSPGATYNDSRDRGYSDSRSGNLQESQGTLYKNIESLVESTPQFTVEYYDEDEQ